MNDSNKKITSDDQYRSNMTRRDSLKWFGVLSASALVPMVTGCNVFSGKNTTGGGHWPQLKLSPITVKGYGKDPNLLMPPSSPWPLTMTADQLILVAVLSDIIIPKDGNAPSASEVKVPDVIDEWVSAPYSGQQKDRLVILSTLSWIDTESKLRFDKVFVALPLSSQLTIIDDIAYKNDRTPEQFIKIATAFARFRQLVVAAFFCSPQGIKDIGYMGNSPIAGDYPGPTDEAMLHLHNVLSELNLSL